MTRLSPFRRSIGIGFLLVLFTWSLPACAESAKQCILADMMLPVEVCNQLDTQASSTPPLEVKIYSKDNAFFSCRMAEMAEGRRTSVRPKVGAWDPQTAIEFGQIYKNTFAKLAHRRVAIASVEFAGGACGENEPPATIAVWTSSDVQWLQVARRCSPFKALVLLRLKDICDGQINTLMISGISQIGELIDRRSSVIPARMFSVGLDKATVKEAFHKKIVFRTRELDVSGSKN